VLLKDKTAIIYGAAGAAGSAVASNFAREGARVFLTGRNVEALAAVAKGIAAAGGVVETAPVDALDEQEVERHADTVAKKAGGIDISFNAIGIPQQGIQGIPLVQLSAESFALPIASYTRSHFLTARAAARRMVERRSGVILMHSPPVSLAVVRYAALFNARDWDGVRAMLADDVRLDVVSREKRAGRPNVSHYFTNYDRVQDWHLVPGWLVGREVLAVFRNPEDARPGYFIELSLRGDQVATIRDFRYVPYVGREAEIVLAQEGRP
jgi:NADP-dependent 3-hydroxy acid dehydrogenase YdfG